MRYWILSLSTLCLADYALASLSARPVLVSFEPGQDQRADIAITNLADRVQYLEISAEKIVSPGAVPEEVFSSPNPDEVGLLVAPRRITLQPGEERLIRVILLEAPSKTDKAWRVLIMPVVGKIESTGSAAAINVAYRALVFARPQTPKVDLSGHRDGRVLSIPNTGNTNAMLHSGSQCAPGDICTEITGKRLWPGMQWQVELPTDAPVQFSVRGPGAEQLIEF